MTAPVQYYLSNDAHAARFGLQPWERDYLLGQMFTNRLGAPIIGIGHHIQDGRTPGSLNHWVHGKTWDGRPIQASSTVLVQRDGSVLWCIDPKHGPWTNGDVNRASPRIAWLTGKPGNVNNYCITIEAEAYAWEGLTEAQMTTIVWLDEGWMKDYPAITLDHLFGHYEVNSVDKSECGLYVNAVRDRIAAKSDPTTSPPATTSPKFQTVVRFDKPQRVLVTAQIGVNVREWGELDARIITAYPHGRQFYASGYVYGEDVSGEDRWYILSGTGHRIWSGATNQPRF